MKIEQVQLWYTQAGYRATLRPLLGESHARFRPDLLLERGNERRAVMYSEKPVELDAVGAFARTCSVHGLDATIVAPSSRLLAAGCAAEDVQFLDIERLDRTHLLPSNAPPPLVHGQIATTPTPEPVAEATAVDAPPNVAPSPPPARVSRVWLRASLVVLAMVTAIVLVAAVVLVSAP